MTVDARLRTLGHDLDACECSACCVMRRRALRTGATVWPIAPDRIRQWKWDDDEPDVYQADTWRPDVEDIDAWPGDNEWVDGALAILMGGVPKEHPCYFMGAVLVLIQGVGLRVVRRDRLVSVQTADWVG